MLLAGELATTVVPDTATEMPKASFSVGVGSVNVRTRAPVAVLYTYATPSVAVPSMLASGAPTTVKRVSAATLEPASLPACGPW